MIQFQRETCDFCGTCVGVCPVDVITLEKIDLIIDHEACIDCNFCVEVCPSRSLLQDDPGKRKGSSKQSRAA